MYPSQLKQKHLSQLAAMVLILALDVNTARAQAVDSQVIPITTPQDTLLENVAAGTCADFDNEKLSIGFVNFLGQLLSGQVVGVTVHGNGVCIRNAKLPAIRWRNAEIKHEVKFEACAFDDIDLSQAHLHKSLSLRKSRLASKNARASFAGMTVDGNVEFHDVNFNEAVLISFNGCLIRKNFAIDRAKIEGRKKKIDFENMKVGGNASFKHARLNGIEISFSGTTVGGRADFDRASISIPDFARENKVIDFSTLNVNGQARFKSMKINGPVRFDSMVVDVADFGGTVFDGGRVDFLLAEIKTNFEVNRAKFLSLESTRFNGTTVGGSALFHGTVFRGPVDFGLTDITGNLEADNAIFWSDAIPNPASPCGEESSTGTYREISFASMRVGQSARFPKATFCRPISFSRASIPRSLVIEDADFHRNADFDSAQIGGDLHADKAHFSRKASFNSLTVGGMARFFWSIFGGSADFSYAQVHGNFVATNARFYGKAVFSSSRINGDFEADAAIFKSAANLSGIEVEGSAQFQNSEFHGEATFTSAQVSRDLVANGTQFLERAHFNRIQVGGNVSFSESTGKKTKTVDFHGQVSFQQAEIGGDLVALATTFRNQVTLQGIKLNGDVNLCAEFKGPVNFESARVDGDFKATKTKFLSRASFRGMMVGRSVSLAPPEYRKSVSNNEESIEDYGSLCAAFEKDRTLFSDSAEFAQAEINQSFEADCTKFEKADFNGMKVARDANFRGAVFAAGVNFQYVDINNADLDSAQVSVAAKLEHAKFGTLKTGNATWPDENGVLKLEHITYKRLVPSNETSDDDDQNARWRDVLDWFKKADYSPQFYGELEESLKADGKPEIADDVYVAMKQRERETHKSAARRFGSIILEHLVAYGRKPYKALLWSALVILVGFVVYMDPRDVQPRNPPDEEQSRLQQFDVLFLPSLKDQNHPFKPYNALWFSLDLFLPFINLRASDMWMPRQDQFFRRNYAKIHTLLGWVLVPIGLASITGIVK